MSNSTKSTSKTKRSKKRTVPYILDSKGSGVKLVALTAYDFTTATLLDDTQQVDIILVGDSAASLFQGASNTLPVTLDEMVYHCKCVSKAVENALVVGDMPFLSYQISPEQAIQSAGRMIKEGGAQAIKLEGGRVMHETISRLVSLDIPVIGHVGLTPQSYHRMGGHKIQGKKTTSRAHRSAQEVLENALAIEDAGAFAMVIEGVPSELAERITNSVSIPTIGIGAGSSCDGQILVTHDLLGMQPEFQPRFVKRYRELGLEIQEAVKEFVNDVREGEFPSNEHTVSERPKVHLAKK